MGSSLGRRAVAQDHRRGLLRQYDTGGRKDRFIWNDPETVRQPCCHTGSAIEYFTWLSAKLDSIEAMPSSRVSLVFRKVS